MKLSICLFCNQPSEEKKDDDKEAEKTATNKTVESKPITVKEEIKAETIVVDVKEPSAESFKESTEK